MDAIRDVLKLSPEQQRVCLGQAAEDVTWALDHAGKAGRAWAVGDIGTVKANYGESRFGNCILTAVKAMGDIDARNTADTVAAIDAALEPARQDHCGGQYGTLAAQGRRAGAASSPPPRHRRTS